MVRKLFGHGMAEYPSILREQAEAAGFPIIQINEETNTSYYTDDDEDAIPNFSGEYLFDTLRLVNIDDPNIDFGSLFYVASIIEAILNGGTRITSSRKFSFGDTPDWWDDFAPEPTDTVERKLVYATVYINY